MFKQYRQDPIEHLRGRGEWGQGRNRERMGSKTLFPRKCGYSGKHSDTASMMKDAPTTALSLKKARNVSFTKTIKKYFENIEKCGVLTGMN